MAKDKGKIAFGTSFRGYRKADVNEFIERKAADFAKKEEEFTSLLRQKDEKLGEAQAENSRLAEILAESDKVIIEQKATIDEMEALTDKLKAELEEKELAFTELSAEIDAMSDRIATLVKEQELAAEAKKELPRVKLEKKAEPKVKSADADSVTNALKTIKNKILSFLK